MLISKCLLTAVFWTLHQDSERRDDAFAQALYEQAFDAEIGDEPTTMFFYFEEALEFAMSNPPDRKSSRKVRSKIFYHVSTQWALQRCFAEVR